MEKDYKKEIERIRKVYKKIQDTYCPVLFSKITFNGQGFHHLRYHGGGRSRTVEDTLYKIKLFPYILPVIINSRKIVGYKKVLEPQNRTNIRPQKEVEYWAIVAEDKKLHNIKVILKRIGKGKLMFWSVMKTKK
ncbi:MAG: hypothetical protein ABIO57_02135 [Candidatus Paceibacterota bacterium]